MTADVLREKFLQFFKSKKHKIVESDSLVPKDDPTVLFTPAGMNQFKKQFLGQITGFTRAATSQRCLRTDDLDKVGKTTGHHTFFEMLGNFSFGDYFKKEAITWAWEFLTGELKISPEKLWVSVYKDDDEAYGIWKDEVGVAQERIVKLGDKDNFWPAEAKEKGPNGPCGPCSEIFYDFGKDVGCREKICDPSCSCGRFVEIWNLVFTQFNRKEGGQLEPLPKKNIDTGMGLERLAAVMQGAKNNFETELFQPIIKAIEQEASRSIQAANAYAVADHLRAICFSIYDGVIPSNEERGYVIRKLIRKSSLHIKSMGIKKLFLYKLVPILAEIMQKPYPELKERQENIAQIILEEERAFLANLDNSEPLFESKFQNLKTNSDPDAAGKIAFQLYDTYGIPAELTFDWLSKHKIEVSKDAFERAMDEQKQRSKAGSAMKGDVFSLKGLKLDVKETKFLGYKTTLSKAKILKIFQDGKEVKKIKQGDSAEIVLDQTPFYAESGGQVADIGELVKGKNIFQVLDTQKNGKVTIHLGKVTKGGFKKADSLNAQVDRERRLSIARNHTATHLLQAALRKVLGPHVQQQGSLVAAEKLRFDFTHFKGLNQEELERIEEEVYQSVIENYSLSTKILTLAQAKKTGALAFFAEKYEGKVRVVSVGEVSRELCGGTHLAATGNIGLFKILHEGSVASGVRRIEAVTGKYAYQLIKEEKEKQQEELEKAFGHQRELEKQLGSQKLGQAKNSLNDLLEKIENINGLKVIAQVLPDLDMGLLRKSVDLIKEKSDNTIIALGSIQSAKALLVVAVTADLCAKGIDATKIIVEAAKPIGGSGGGRKDFAQAGGTQPENFEQAFAIIKKIASEVK
ncbi:MAG: alanine--tRNA ligase [Candidatus Omnitrophica bacterium]|nr:alanine--tRNA ligase [Candidatus Omnitrophota bacterium]MDD5652956.1 alanine--tRNA ligase [Candidatus Omnitrophota bacterium]